MNGITASQQRKGTNTINLTRAMQITDVDLAGKCELQFITNNGVIYEPPAYLFPELIPKVDKSTAAASTPQEFLDRVISALNASESSWPVCTLETSASNTTDGSGNPSILGTSQHTAEDTFARLVMQGAFTPIHLTPEALDPITGFSTNSVMDGIRRVAERIAATASARKRCILGRCLSPQELSEEETLMKQVCFSPHFVNVLAWQRLQEITCTSHLPSEGEQAVKVPEVKEGNPVLLPSSDPWQQAYPQSPQSSSVFVASPESRSDLKVPLYRLLSEQLRDDQKYWIDAASTSTQTDDVVIKKACQGIVRLMSPFATATFPGVITQNMVRTALDKMEARGASEGSSATNGWSVTLRSISPSVTPLADKTFVVPLHQGTVVLGRSEGYNTDASLYVDIGLEGFTEHPKRISPAHCGLFASVPGGSNELTVVAFGRNGVRVVGSKWLLAGQSLRISGKEKRTVFLTSDVVMTIAPMSAE